MKQPNNPLIKEWVNKAEGDFAAATILNKSRSNKKTFYIIAFHCQQAIEKYLKALLTCHKTDFPKIHDLVELLNLIKDKDPLLQGIKKELIILNPFAVGFRYPGEDIEAKELKIVIKTARFLRDILIKRIKQCEK